MVDAHTYISLAVNDAYATAALVLGDSIRDTNTTRQLALLVTNNVTLSMRGRLAKIWDQIIDIEALDDSYVADFLERPDLEKIFIKLKIWKLTQFKKCVFLDADTLVLQNVDELFDRDELSAAPDIGWPDCFNSGVLVFVPSNETYTSLVKHAEEHGSFDESDQGVLNTYFKNWSTTTGLHLPYIYNMVPNPCYTYVPALNYFGKDIKIVHFVGSSKPWSQYYDYGQCRVIGPPSGHPDSSSSAYLNAWWNRYHNLQKRLAFEQYEVVAEEHMNNVKPAWEDQRETSNEVSDQQKAWERGEIDFARKDRFAVIQYHLDNAMGETSIEPYNETHFEHYYEHMIGEQNHHENTSQCENQHEYRKEEENEQVEGRQGEGQPCGNTLVFHVEYNWSPVVETQHQDDFQEQPSHEVTGASEWNASSVEEVVELEQEELDPDVAARLRWEIGDIDFNGEDSFAKIELYLNSLLQRMEESLNVEEDETKEFEELNFPLRGDQSDFSDANGTDDSRPSRDTSPSNFSVADSAYSEVMLKKPVMISRATQTSSMSQSKAVQTNFEQLIGDT